MKHNTHKSDTLNGRIDSVIGKFRVSVTPQGLRSVRLPEMTGEDSAAVQADTPDLFPARHPQADWFHMTRHWITAYLSGHPLPALPPIDMAWCTPFGKQVYQLLMTVPAGHTITYGELAFELNRPNAARAIGSWMAKNQIPVIIPCHRVLRQNGNLGGWSGPAGMKEWLLNHERNAAFT